MRNHISQFHQEDSNKYEFIQQLRKRKGSQVAVTKPAGKKAKIDHDSLSEEDESSVVFTSSDSCFSSDSE